MCGAVARLLSPRLLIPRRLLSQHLQSLHHLLPPLERLVAAVLGVQTRVMGRAGIFGATTTTHQLPVSMDVRLARQAAQRLVCLSSEQDAQIPAVLTPADGEPYTQLTS